MAINLFNPSSGEDNLTAVAVRMGISVVSLTHKNFSACQRGIVAIVWALVLPIVLGFIALGIETSLWYAKRIDLQSATDAAAIALTHWLDRPEQLVTVAGAEMTRNGFGADTNVTFTVNYPPQSGAYAGNKRAVEIISSVPQRLLFGAAAFPMRGDSLLLVRSVALKGSGVVE